MPGKPRPAAQNRPPTAAPSSTLRSSPAQRPPRPYPTGAPEISLSQPPPPPPTRGTLPLVGLAIVLASRSIRSGRQGSRAFNSQAQRQVISDWRCVACAPMRPTVSGELAGRRSQLDRQARLRVEGGRSPGKGHACRGGPGRRRGACSGRSRRSTRRRKPGRTSRTSSCSTTTSPSAPPS